MKYTNISAFINLCDKTGSIIEKGTGITCAVSSGMLVVVVAMGVFFRFIIHSPLQWGEELARFLMLWTGFVAMNIAMRQDAHIKINVISKLLPVWMQHLLDYTNYLLIGFFLLVLIIKGYGMAASTRITALVLPISMSWIYASVPVGAGLTFLQLVLNFIKRILSDIRRFQQTS